MFAQCTIVRCGRLVGSFVSQSGQATAIGPCLRHLVTVVSKTFVAVDDDDVNDAKQYFGQ